MKELCDGWHTVCGYEVYVEGGKILRGAIKNGSSKTTAYVYRAIKNGGWEKEESVTIHAFRSGANRGSIRLMEGER